MQINHEDMCIYFSLKSEVQSFKIKTRDFLKQKLIYIHVHVCKIIVLLDKVYCITFQLKYHKLYFSTCINWIVNAVVCLCLSVMRAEGMGRSCVLALGLSVVLLCNIFQVFFQSYALFRNINWLFHFFPREICSMNVLSVQFSW